MRRDQLSRCTFRVVAGELGASIDKRFEEVLALPEFVLSPRAFLLTDSVPVRSGYDYVLQSSVTTELPKHPQILLGDPAHPWIRNSVHVDDAAQLQRFPVREPGNLSLSDTTSQLSMESYPRGGQKVGNFLQDIDIAYVAGVIETRSINERYKTTFLFIKISRDADVICLRLLSVTDAYILVACNKLDKLMAAFSHDSSCSEF
jgi:hypothetical protein